MTRNTTIRLVGIEAITHAETHDRTLNKYADTLDVERYCLTVDEARAIAREDPSLIWIDVEWLPIAPGGVVCLHCGSRGAIVAHQTCSDCRAEQLGMTWVRQARLVSGWWGSAREDLADAAITEARRKLETPSKESDR